MNTSIKPIRTDEDHAAALARIDALFAAPPDTAGHDELEVLVTLVEAYEREHFPIEPPSPIEAIEFAMDQGRLTRADLVPIMGSSAKVAEVLNGRRGLSKAMIVRLHKAYAIPYESLLSDIERAHVTSKRKGAPKTKSAKAKSAKSRSTSKSKSKSKVTFRAPEKGSKRDRSPAKRREPRRTLRDRGLVVEAG